MNPKINFKISPGKDIQNAKWFFEDKDFLDMFLPENFKYLMDDKYSIKERNSLLTIQTKKTYSEKKIEIESGVKKIQKDWSEIQNKYFDYINYVFNNHPWPKGTYTGYSSIFLMFPRNIEDKSFFFPYNDEKWNPLETIAHEMTHFLFFDYLKSHYGLTEQSLIKGKNQEYIWQVSETFNTLIENLPDYKEIFGAQIDTKPYPGCEKLLIDMKKIWANEKDINTLLDEMFKKS
ncbi:MAG: hypothetical protein RBS56_00500 [Candidatus Gracilibacteria bacterium]|jgi:hypothetical protein|nr:hypothetical protein [Candidatus Gracilibacteria bacterium]